MATIGFSTQIKGVETNFVPKIWKGLINNGLADEGMLLKYCLISVEDGRIKVVESFPTISAVNRAVAKLHTIRKDEKNRWKVGDKIHMVIFNRTNNRFQFAPVLEVKGIQKIEILIDTLNSDYRKVIINSKEYNVWNKEGYQLIEQLALNDGFDSVEKFFQWFKEDFNGKIIHWTHLKY